MDAAGTTIPEDADSAVATKAIRDGSGPERRDTGPVGEALAATIAACGPLDGPGERGTVSVHHQLIIGADVDVLTPSTQPGSTAALTSPGSTPGSLASPRTPRRTPAAQTRT